MKRTSSYKLMTIPSIDGFVPRSQANIETSPSISCSATKLGKYSRTQYDIVSKISENKFRKGTRKSKAGYERIVEELITEDNTAVTAKHFISFGDLSETNSETQNQWGFKSILIKAYEGQYKGSYDLLHDVYQMFDKFMELHPPEDNMNHIAQQLLSAFTEKWKNMDRKYWLGLLRKVRSSIHKTWPKMNLQDGKSFLEYLQGEMLTIFQTFEADETVSGDIHHFLCIEKPTSTSQTLLNRFWDSNIGSNGSIDLGQIRRNLVAKLYQSSDDLCLDIFMMFQTFINFFPATHEFNVAAEKINLLFWNKYMEKLLCIEDAGSVDNYSIVYSYESESETDDEDNDPDFFPASGKSLRRKRTGHSANATTPKMPSKLWQSRRKSMRLATRFEQRQVHQTRNQVEGELVSNGGQINQSFSKKADSNAYLYITEQHEPDSTNPSNSVAPEEVMDNAVNQDRLPALEHVKINSNPTSRASIHVRSELDAFKALAVTHPQNQTQPSKGKQEEFYFKGGDKADSGDMEPDSTNLPDTETSVKRVENEVPLQDRRPAEEHEQSSFLHTFMAAMYVISERETASSLTMVHPQLESQHPKDQVEDTDFSLISLCSQHVVQGNFEQDVYIGEGNKADSRDADTL